MNPEAAIAPSDVRRILLIGDSFTFGVGSDYPDTWGARLETILRERECPVAVTNAGVPGYDTQQEVGLLSRWIDELDPYLVILTFLPNDLFGVDSGGAAESQGPVAPRESRLAGLADLQVVTALKRLLLQSDSLYLRTYQLTARRKYFESPMQTSVRRKLETVQKSLLEAASVCKQRNTKLTVASLPQLFQVILRGRGDRIDGIDPSVIDRELAIFADANGLVWFPVLEPFSEEYSRARGDLYYRLDGHLTPRGNLLFAELMAEEIMRTLKCGGVSAGLLGEPSKPEQCPRRRFAIGLASGENQRL